MEDVRSARAVAQANATYGIACARVGLRTNLTKTRLLPGRGTIMNNLTGGLEVDERAVVPRHGEEMPVLALSAATPAGGSRLAEGSEEMTSFAKKRAGFRKCMNDLRAGGLKSQFALYMLRVRAAGDLAFVARASRIPAQEAASFDSAWLCEACRDVTANPLKDQEIFLLQIAVWGSKRATNKLRCTCGLWALVLAKHFGAPWFAKRECADSRQAHAANGWLPGSSLGICQSALIELGQLTAGLDEARMAKPAWIHLGQLTAGLRPPRTSEGWLGWNLGG